MHDARRPPGLLLGASSLGGVEVSAVHLLRLLVVSAALMCLMHETASASGWSHEAVRETRARGVGWRQGDRRAGRGQWLGRRNGPPADAPGGAGGRRLRDLLSLRGGDADWAHGGNDVLPDPEQIRDSGSSEMADGSEWDELDEMSLHASQLALSDELPVNETANNESTDPGLLAERYWALPAESRQLLDDLVRTRWQLSNASLADAVLEPHENGTEPQTGMKLEAVWNGDEQICVRVVEAESRSGVQAGDILKTVEGIDCSKKSLAEVGHLIAEANRDKLSVQIGMLRNGTQGQAGGGEVGGGARLRQSCILLPWNVVGLLLVPRIR